jgi:hypothetical protein
MIRRATMRRSPMKDFLLALVVYVITLVVATRR